MKILATPRMERCIGCHSCSLACARLIHHRLSWDTAGIRIRSTGGLSTGFEARPCLACDPAPCAEACPTGAYTQRRGRRGGEEEAVHSLRGLCPGLPGGRHLPESVRRTFRLHPLRPLCTILSP